MSSLSVKVVAAASALSILPLLPSEAKEVKVAAVEFAAISPGFDENLKGILEALTAAARNGAKLMVLPEAATTGFMYPDAKALGHFADTIPGKTTAAIEKVTREFDAYVVTGMYEKDPATGALHNSAVLIGPSGYIGKYRKNNLAPGEGVMVSPGQLGFPVFDTKIGKIGLVICYDDSNIQNLITPVLRGADIIVQPIGSFKIANYLGASVTNHSTMANMSTATAWLGTNVVSSNSTGTEGPGRGLVSFDGGSSIWNADGKRLISADVSSWTQRKKPQTVYATIDIDKQSEQKNFWLKQRRPELYADVNSYRYPDDSNADSKPRQISALLVQYEAKLGQIDDNAKKIDELIRNSTGVFNLSILPFNSFLGNIKITKDNIAQYAEALDGKSVKLAAAIAQKYKTYLLVSLPEKNGSDFYQTAVLLDYNGKQVGTYRKTHLNDDEKAWAKAGNDLPVFSTADLGRVAIVLNDEVRIPELAILYSIYRADLTLIPTAYNAQDYGVSVNIPNGIVPEASNRGMALWYNFAKYSQTYTLVANYLSSSPNGMGHSAVYGLAPEIGYDAPRIASAKEEAYPVQFTTHANPTIYTDQQKMIASRRWDQAAPLALDMKSDCFAEWKQNSTSKDVCPKTAAR